MQSVFVSHYLDFVFFCCCSGYPLHRENRENGQKKSLSGKTQGIWKFCKNTRTLICSICKLPDSKGKRYPDICRKKIHFFFISWISLQESFVYVILTNHVKWHRESLRLDREKQGI